MASRNKGSIDEGFVRCKCPPIQGSTVGPYDQGLGSRCPVSSAGRMALFDDRQLSWGTANGYPRHQHWGNIAWEHEALGAECIASGVLPTLDIPVPKTVGHSG